jgi:hypothetical protein
MHLYGLSRAHHQYDNTGKLRPSFQVRSCLVPQPQLAIGAVAWPHLRRGKQPRRVLLPVKAVTYQTLVPIQTAVSGVWQPQLCCGVVWRGVAWREPNSLLLLDNRRNK